MTRAIALALLLVLAGCQTAPVSTVCTDIAKVEAGPAAAQLNAIDPHSAVGVLWSQVTASCVAGTPVAGVQTDWIGMVWGMLKTAAPVVLPLLIGLI